MELIASENIDDDTAAAISEVALTAQGVKVRLHDKLSALVNLGKHVGCFPTRLEHGGIGGGAIEIKAVEMTDKEYARRALFLLAEAHEQAKELDRLPPARRKAQSSYALHHAEKKERNVETKR